jgi:ankyrin repeat protein
MQQIDFILACKLGNLEDVKKNINSISPLNKGLIIACRNVHMELVELLLDHGASYSYNNYEPLQYASINYDARVFRLFLERGLDINKVTNKRALIEMFKSHFKFNMLIDFGLKITPKHIEITNGLYDEGMIELINKQFMIQKLSSL